MRIIEPTGRASSKLLKAGIPSLANQEPVVRRDGIPLGPRPDCVDGRARKRRKLGEASGSDNVMMMSHADLMQNAREERKCLLHQSIAYAECMTEISGRLKSARIRAGYTSASSAAEAMGVSGATYIQHENGARGVPRPKLERYARFFRVSPEWLTFGSRGDDVESHQLGPRVFVKGEVAAGVWREAWEIPEDEWEAYTGRADVAVPLQDRFGLRVVGDSMGLIYPPGSIIDCVAYRGDVEIPSGKRVVVQRTRVDGCIEATVKEYMIDESGVRWFVPRSNNPAFQAFRADEPGDGVVRVEIIGIVVASIRPE